MKVGFTVCSCVVRRTAIFLQRSTRCVCEVSVPLWPACRTNKLLDFVLSPRHVHREKFLFLPNLHVAAGPQGAFFLRRLLHGREARLKPCQADFLSSINSVVAAGLREDDSVQLAVRRLAV